MEIVSGLDTGTVIVVYGTVEGGLARLDFIPTERRGRSALLGKGT